MAKPMKEKASRILNSFDNLIAQGERVREGKDKVNSPYPKIRHYPSTLTYVPQGCKDEVSVLDRYGVPPFCVRQVVMLKLGFPTPPIDDCGMHAIQRGNTVAGADAESLRMVPDEYFKSMTALEAHKVIDDGVEPLAMSYVKHVDDSLLLPDSGRFDLAFVPIKKYSKEKLEESIWSDQTFIVEQKTPRAKNLTPSKDLSLRYFMQVASYVIMHPSHIAGLVARSGGSEQWRAYLAYLDGDVVRIDLAAGQGGYRIPQTRTLSVKGLIQGRRDVESILNQILNEGAFDKKSHLDKPQHIQEYYDSKDGRKQHWLCSYCNFGEYCWYAKSIKEWKEEMLPWAKEQYSEILKVKDDKAAICEVAKTHSQK